jgi:hypothetical protein
MSITSDATIREIRALNMYRLIGMLKYSSGWS